MTFDKDGDAVLRECFGTRPHTGFAQMTNIVKHKGKTWMVDTNDTPDCSLESMIFASKEQPETDNRADIDYGKINWFGVYTEYYENIDDATAGHKRIVAHIEQYV